MTVIRQYTFTASDGDKLIAAVNLLAGTLKGIPGYIGLELLRDAEKPESFVLNETWGSQEEHKAGLKAVPREVGAQLVGAAAEISPGCYLESVAKG